MLHAYIIDDEPKAVETIEMLLRLHVPEAGKISRGYLCHPGHPVQRIGLSAQAR
ncbi:MAG: hypothetical protein SH848_07370 [Saprospiraceae bacterium]|nr:hypothetical protein [Saprospiraceae bacterium]MDZ4703732.1 hypothetical protein [Saprospiraceae bacterium]